MNSRLLIARQMHDQTRGVSCGDQDAATGREDDSLTLFVDPRVDESPGSEPDDHPGWWPGWGEPPRQEQR